MLMFMRLSGSLTWSTATDNHVVHDAGHHVDHTTIPDQLPILKPSPDRKSGAKKTHKHQHLVGFGGILGITLGKRTKSLCRPLCRLKSAHFSIEMPQGAARLAGAGPGPWRRLAEPLPEAFLWRSEQI